MDRHDIDANLLIALDALLTEQSVTRAAEELRTSPAAMSRTLARLRRVIGDPLLVRAGQRMVPTPRAEALRGDVAEVVRQCGVLLTPGVGADPAVLRTTFNVQAGDLLTAGLAPRLIEIAAAEAPRASVRFVAEDLEDGPALRDGRIDLEVGVLDHIDPETMTEDLVTLQMVAAVRRGHPLTRGTMTPQRFADASHVTVSRRGRFQGPVDVALADLGLQRRVVSVLPSHVGAMALASRTEFVCLIPVKEVGSGQGRLLNLATSMGLEVFDLPVTLPPVPIGMAWHPRQSKDGGHAWLRSAVRRAISTEPVGDIGQRG